MVMCDFQIDVSPIIDRRYNKKSCIDNFSSLYINSIPIRHIDE